MISSIWLVACILSLILSYGYLEYRELQLRYSGLKNRCDIVEEYLLMVKSGLREISDRVVIPEELLPRLLSQSLEGRIFSITREDLLLREDMEPEVKARRIMEWVMVNMQYFSDDYHHYLVDGKKCVGHDYWALPNETLARGGGDCEDLATLVYAMLKSVLGESEEVYLIGIMERYYYRDGWGRAHVAVLYKSEKGFMVLDPAMSYVTNGKIVLSLNIESNGTIYNVKLRSIDLSPEHKRYLLGSGLARLVYTDPINPSNQAEQIYKFSDIESSVNSWLSYTSSKIPFAEVWILANDSFVETFVSTDSFFKFMVS